MEGSIHREISVNLLLLVKDTESELLSFHQEVKRFQREWTCWHSTNRCSTVYFNLHTWQESLSLILALKSLSLFFQDVMVYFKLKHRKLFIFCAWAGMEERICLSCEASLNKTNFWCRFLEWFRYIKRACLPASGRWFLKWLNWLIRNYQVIFVMTSKDFPPMLWYCVTQANNYMKYYHAYLSL